MTQDTYGKTIFVKKVKADNLPVLFEEIYSEPFVNNKSKKKKLKKDVRESALTVETMNTETEAAHSSLGHLNSGADTKEIFEPIIDQDNIAKGVKFT